MYKPVISRVVTATTVSAFDSRRVSRLMGMPFREIASGSCRPASIWFGCRSTVGPSRRTGRVGLGIPAHGIPAHGILPAPAPAPARPRQSLPVGPCVAVASAGPGRHTLSLALGFIGGLPRPAGAEVTWQGDRDCSERGDYADNLGRRLVIPPLHPHVDPVEAYLSRVSAPCGMTTPCRMHGARAFTASIVRPAAGRRAASGLDAGGPSERMGELCHRAQALPMSSRPSRR